MADKQPQSKTEGTRAHQNLKGFFPQQDPWKILLTKGVTFIAEKKDVQSSSLFFPNSQKI